MAFVSEALAILTFTTCPEVSAVSVYVADT